MSEPGHIAAAARLSPPVTATRHFTVPAGRLVQDWKTAYERAVVYLKGLGLEGRECEPLASEAVERALQHEPWGEGSDAVAETFHALQALLPQRYPIVPKPWHEALDAFTAWRVEACLSGRFAAAELAVPPSAGQYPLRDGVLSSMPRLTRHVMVPDKIERRFRRRLLNRLRGKSSNAPRRKALRHQRRRLPWTRVARRRRLLLSVLVLIPSVIASGFMVSVLPQQASTWLEFAIVIFFGALFGWISIGFWTALLGFFTLIGRRCRFAITNLDPSDSGEFHPEGRTAVVMPICDEPVDRVFAGLKAIYASLARTGALAHFDFFILSDSGDPGTWVKEEEAWAEWCRAVNGFGTIFYRRRRVRLERKSGNVADFCRRWGHQYRYMIMLDADSIMAGDTLVRLVRMMERHPDAGMIQTAPTAVNRRSLFARVQQFAARVYGPMFAAGLHYWQLGDGQYWGHNAIIRVAPFMHHCGLPRLPGRPPLGGEILSHDFVEAALMGRAGWTLWLAFDLPGSYEEVPVDAARRDEARPALVPGQPATSAAAVHRRAVRCASRAVPQRRAVVRVGVTVVRVPDAEHRGGHPERAARAGVLPARAQFVSGVAGVASRLGAVPGRRHRHDPLPAEAAQHRAHRVQAAQRQGCTAASLRLSLSVFLEILLSSLLAPIRMVFHSRFVVQNLLGRTVQWRSQGREDAETRWWEAIRRHGFDTVFASAWGISLYWLNPTTSGG